MLNFGRRSGFLSTVAIVATLITSAASAQNLSNANPPAEFPPSSFTANQYVDSRGCVFVRAGIGGTVDWVPRVTRGRQQLCGFQPTQVANTTTRAPTSLANVPNPLDTPVAGLEARPVTPSAPVVAAAPTPAPAPVVRAPAPVVRAPAPVIAAAPTPRRDLPTSTAGAINPLTGQPIGVNAARSPVVAAASTPRVITPAPVQQPRVLTRAQACAGLTGIQPNLIGQRTGQPIDCGNNAPEQVAAVTRPAVQAPTQQRRITRVEACADMDATGRQYVSASSGLPIRCGPQLQPVSTGSFAQIQADLRAPQRPYSNPLDAAPGSTFFPERTQVAAASNRIPYSNPLDSAPGATFAPGANTRLATTCNFGMTSGVGLPVRCGPQAQSPSGGVNAATVTRARAAPASQSVLGELGQLINPAPPPYSNPTQAYALPAPTVPTNYARVWDDGRLNTQRGLPASAYQVRNPSAMVIRTGPQAQSPTGYTNTVRYATQPIRPQAVQPETTTRAVAPQPQRSEQISGHRYVQVGTFATRNEAQAIAQNLRARGLPMRVGVYQQQGREMRIVLAGPFGSDNQLQNALGAARSAGFSGAFTRR